MIKKAPHFLLLSEAADTHTACPEGEQHRRDTPPEKAVKCWHFVLRSADGKTALDVADFEQDASPERLELLAVVRGLEALPQPSRVTLLTHSGAIRRGLRFGLDQWRENRWRWERFGRMMPIKNADLWRRIDRALDFHDIQCHAAGKDRPSDDLTDRPPQSSPRMTAESGAGQQPCAVPRRWASKRNWWVGQLRRLFSWCGLCRSPAGLMIAAS
jgi:ribonuclease HI